MKVTAEKLEGSRVRLEIESPASIVDEALEKAFRSVVRRYSVPGFRKGKAPRRIFERYYGKEVIYEEAMKQLLPEQYALAVKEANIEPVDEPEFSDVHLSEGEPLRFQATVYVRPEVKLEDYSDIAVPFEMPSVTDEEIDQKIEELRNRMSELRPLAEGEALKSGHYASCHVKSLDGGTITVNFDQDLNYVEVGKELPAIPGLGEALVGLKKGETKEFSGRYPGKEGEEPAEARFSVTVNEVYEKHVPDLEQLVTNLGKASMDELREDLRKQLLEVKMGAARREHMDKVEEALMAKASVDIPAVMVNRAADDILYRFVHRLHEAGLSLEAYLSATGYSREDLENQILEQAQKEVRRELVLDAVAERENVQVPNEMVDRVLEPIARETGKDISTIRTTLQLRGTLSEIERDLTRIQTLKIIAERAAMRAGTPLPADAEEDESKPELQQSGEQKESREESHAGEGSGAERDEVPAQDAEQGEASEAEKAPQGTEPGE